MGQGLGYGQLKVVKIEDVNVVGLDIGFSGVEQDQMVIN